MVRRAAGRGAGILLQTSELCPPSRQGGPLPIAVSARPAGERVHMARRYRAPSTGPWLDTGSGTLRTTLTRPRCAWHDRSEARSPVPAARDRPGKVTVAERISRALPSLSLAVQVVSSCTAESETLARLALTVLRVTGRLTGSHGRRCHPCREPCHCQ